MENKKKNSTTNEKPWQVRGISPETRQAVQQAAKKSGLPIGKWVDKTLHRVAVEEITGSENLPARIEDQMGELLKVIERQGETLDAIQREQQQNWLARLLNR